MKMQKRIFLSIFSGSFISLILSIACIMLVMYNAMTAELRAEIRNEAELVSYAIGSMDTHEAVDEYISEAGRKSGNRITYISPDGTVLFDNYSKISEMENHLDRPEIEDALKNGMGTALRASDTLGESTYYCAVRLENGSVIRIANTAKSALGILSHLTVWIFLICILIFAASAIIAGLLTRSIIRPINELDLDSPTENETYDELTPLLSRMDKQNEKINAQIEKLSEQKSELSFITGNMSEGLVIFGSGGNILSANAAAVKILGSSAEGSYTHLCRDREYLEAVEAALRGEAADRLLEKNGRYYRLTASPVPEARKYSAVLFIVDITDRENSEKMRKEFSANVSHELKTPLTSIMGAAEIIEKGIVKPEDIQHFAGRIHSEALRLLALIEDIIKLSRLDEGGLKQEFEEVSLDGICRSAAAELSQKAADRGVSIDLSLEKVNIMGVSSVLHEMVYNLCDNAVSYNKMGGRAEISLEKTEQGCILKVSDNGIGIAPEHHERIFERFYRADKSHSKETGGTGLGLSIVKHGAALHGGVISLQSEPQKGTVISIEFGNKIST
ncbi:MAG: ATP-binding protein [Oscillospiraceae bacterium]|nr:ATP-binding protein [Oscillospiraceae bacterium]